MKLKVDLGVKSSITKQQKGHVMEKQKILENLLKNGNWEIREGFYYNKKSGQKYTEDVLLAYAQGVADSTNSAKKKFDLVEFLFKWILTFGVLGLLLRVSIYCWKGVF